jgi:hypothetical protein
VPLFFCRIPSWRNLITISSDSVWCALKDTTSLS